LQPSCEPFGSSLRRRASTLRAVFAALTSDAVAAVDTARAVSGTAYVVHDGEPGAYFAGMVIGADRAALETIADVALYEVEVRVLRHQRRFWPEGDPMPGLVAVFSLVRPEGKTHDEHVAHWRDTHAPLALRHHPGMWHYHQVTVQQVISGPDYDGFALLGFPSQQDFAERFFGNDDDVAVISADAPKFVNQSAMPPSVRTTEWRFGTD
jgi:uncharacterized protein (TIGR02118 family)